MSVGAAYDHYTDGEELYVPRHFFETTIIIVILHVFVLVSCIFSRNSCWLSVKRNVIWAFVVPVIVIIMVRDDINFLIWFLNVEYDIEPSFINIFLFQTNVGILFLVVHVLIKNKHQCTDEKFDIVKYDFQWTCKHTKLNGHGNLVTGRL